MIGFANHPPIDQRFPAQKNTRSDAMAVIGAPKPLKDCKLPGLSIYLALSRLRTLTVTSYRLCAVGTEFIVRKQAGFERVTVIEGRGRAAAHSGSDTASSTDIRSGSVGSSPRMINCYPMAFEDLLLGGFILRLMAPGGMSGM